MKQHLIELKASNFKRLVAVHIKPDGASGVLRLSGENEAGKSSVLDALAAVFKGGRHVPEQPIRRGARKAEILAETEDYIITRTFTAKGGTITVRDREGRQYSSPQTLLDKMSSTLGFDPLAFAQMSKVDQVKALLEVCPVGIDLEKNAAETKAAYDERRDHARDFKALEARLEGMAEVTGDVPDKEVSVSELTRTLTGLQTEQRLYGDLLRLCGAKEAEVADLRERLVGAEADLETLTKEIAEAIDPADKIAAVQTKIDAAESDNQRYRDAVKRADLLQEIGAAKEKAERADARLEKLRTARTEALKAARFPVPGLSLDDDGVLLDDLPFSQAADSKKIRVGLALAMAGSPDLRLVFVRNGSLLGKAAMQTLDEMAEQHDLLVLVERVDDETPGAIEIVDGCTAGNGDGNE